MSDRSLQWLLKNKVGHTTVRLRATTVKTAAELKRRQELRCGKVNGGVNKPITDKVWPGIA